MTNQEAIQWIDSRVLELSFIADITNTDKKMQRINREFGALMLARTAIEMQIPMAPDRAIINNDDMWKKATFQCPRCTENILIVEAIKHPVCGFEKSEQGARSPFCKSCGQKLKWEEDAHV